MFFVLGVIHTYKVRVEHRKTYAQHGLHKIKSVLSTEKHMLNTDLILFTVAKSVLSTEKHMLNTDLATVNS
jgi:hypothetical protein